MIAKKTKYKRELFELMNERNAKMNYLCSLLIIPGSLQKVGQNI